MQQPSQVSGTSVRGRPENWAIVAVAAGAFAGLVLLLAAIPNLYDTDSYYHLAVARKYWDEGVRGGLTWARQSVMAAGFGDKEILFHFLLIPFVKVGGTLGGKVAVALLTALVVAQIARLSVRAAGVWGALIPLWLLITAVDLTNRFLRLRPETLSLLLLLVAIESAAARRYRLLGVVASLFTLSHTAWQTLPLLGLLWLMQLRFSRRHWEWQLLAYPLLGTGLALIVHPQFPHNLLVWRMQNIDHFRVLLPDVGAEFSPNVMRNALALNLGWWIGLLLLWRARQPATADTLEVDNRLAGFLSVATLVFGVLFAFLSRFATYFVPVATLALLFELRRRKLRVSSRITLPWRGDVPLFIGFVLLLLLVPSSVQSMGAKLGQAGALAVGREAKARLFGQAVPRGARIAATWGETEYYVYWAPQATYLNVLDPVFMALWRPQIYETSLAVFDGGEPDVPLRAATDLDSDFVALMAAESRTVGQRLLADPRVLWSHRSADSLFTIVADANRSFLLDWKTAPAGAVTDAAESPLTPYPRAATGRARTIEGFVDFRRLSSKNPCNLFVRDTKQPQNVELEYEFAPYGSGALWVDGRLQVMVLSPLKAILGRGVIVPVRLGAGPHTFAVHTCAEESYGGFYLLERKRTPVRTQ